MRQSNQLPPVVLELQAGTYWLCSCGRSQNFPYCNGSHKGTELQPVLLELDSPKTVEISEVARFV